jgi:hypothetical protein
MRDDDHSHDKFHPGVTEEQIRKAEEILGGKDLPTFVEKRNLSADYHTGLLQPLGGRGRVYEVKVSVSPIDGEDRHVLLSHEPLPAMPRAEIAVRRLNQARTLIGRVEESHDGQRDEDRLNSDRLQVAFFHPEG